MQITLVIPIRNEEKSLGSLIDSIRRQTRQPDELILVDGGSTDRTVALARELTAADDRFRIIEAGPAFPGRGRNIGIAAARHLWVALTDAGIRLDPAWLERLLAALERNPALDVVYGNYEPAVSSRIQERAVLAYVAPPMPRPGGLQRGSSIASSLLRVAVWREVGGFPDYRAAEDLLFMEAIEARGFRVGWAPDATVRWEIQPSLSGTFRRFALYSRHNVWAGRQRFWHYGIARQYLFALPITALGLLHSTAWLAVLVLGGTARVFRSVWTRREGRGVAWALNPVRLVGVGLVLATIDLATFVGWAQALCTRPPLPVPTHLKDALSSRERPPPV